MFKLKVLSQVVAAAVASSFLVGCGGGSSTGTAASTTTNVSGSAFASYVSGASVVAMDGVNEIAGPVKTSANGGFTLPIPNANLKSQLVFKATGGTYIDEATGEETTSGELSVVAGANTLKAGSSIHATPSSTIIKMLMKKHDMTKDKAEEAFEAAFGYLPDTSVAPVDVTKASDAEDASKLAGLRAAAFSQLLKDLKLSKDDHAELIGVLAEDLVDGVLDGKNGGATLQLMGKDVPSDIASGFSRALVSFLDGAGKDSGLGLGKVGMIPFHAEAISGDYKFTIPKMTKFSQGKTTFELTVTDLQGDAVDTLTGTKPDMMPMMYMEGMTHSTPHLGCEDFTAQGVSTCTAYFLMPTMMNGSFAGNWNLNFTVDGESVDFFPKVGMVMGVRASLKGVSDQIPSMTSPGNTEGRRYDIFNNGLSGMGNDRDIELFISALETMKNFPPLVDGRVLNVGKSHELTTDTIVVKVSTNNSDWVLASTNGDGLWTATGLTGLVDGEKSTIYVTLSVAGDQKTINSQNSAEFMVTPGANSMNMSM